MAREPLPRLDANPHLREALLRFCRLKPGQIWQDPLQGHRVGALDASKADQVAGLMASGERADGCRASLAVHDPPYNIAVGNRSTGSLWSGPVEAYLDFSRRWIANSVAHLADDAHFYLWLGADQARGFQPLPEIMLLMREIPDLRSRSFITLRNQRGYGTARNWMCVRQELLYYVKGDPPFTVIYTDIPKILRGYYKEINGRRVSNSERGRSPTIRSGNVWVDVQQVFYRLEENVPGAYAQKPLKAMERILAASKTMAGPGLPLVIDFFAHAGTTLMAAERRGWRCYTCDIDPIFAELTIRRLENFRRTGRTGWQWENPFPEYSPG
jgi:DNA modification methylase